MPSKIRLDPAALRRIRNERGLTRQDLADAIGQHITSIRRYELGNRQHPHPATVQAMACVLQCRPEDLLIRGGGPG
ncbi:helix-turn-helix transcriptional regulator [Streptomyces sp. NPDC047117]|uniref:helix-turn-helix domain-containing protein n=1 Tax=Streptomyces sp. NPDC047117 TaxID=3155379 RepID=UPI0033EBFC7F